MRYKNEIETKEQKKRLRKVKMKLERPLQTS